MIHLIQQIFEYINTNTENFLSNKTDFSNSNGIIEVLDKIKLS